MSKESPMKVPSSEDEVVVVVVRGSYRMGSVRKSLPSACLRQAGTLSFLRVEATSGSGIQVVR